MTGGAGVNGVAGAGKGVGGAVSSASCVGTGVGGDVGKAHEFTPSTHIKTPSVLVIDEQPPPIKQAEGNSAP
jgi:hypothetical protein